MEALFWPNGIAWWYWLLVVFFLCEDGRFFLRTLIEAWYVAFSWILRNSPYLIDYCSDYRVNEFLIPDGQKLLVRFLGQAEFHGTKNCTFDCRAGKNRRWRVLKQQHSLYVRKRAKNVAQFPRLQHCVLMQDGAKANTAKATVNVLEHENVRVWKTGPETPQTWMWLNMSGQFCRNPFRSSAGPGQFCKSRARNRGTTHIPSNGGVGRFKLGISHKSRRKFRPRVAWLSGQRGEKYRILTWELRKSRVTEWNTNRDYCTFRA